MASRFDDITITGTVKCEETAISPQLRTSILKQTDNAIFPIPWDSLRVWDAYTTNLPATAAADDLGLISSTFGTAPPFIQAGDLKAVGATTRRARFQVIVPECYVAAETLSIVVTGGMTTAVADVSCTVDIECYRADKITGISADLCATAAQSINSLTFAAKTFSITPATLSAGDILDVRLSIACNDAATITPSTVIPTVAGLDLYCDIKG